MGFEWNKDVYMVTKYKLVELYIPCHLENIFSVTKTHNITQYLIVWVYSQTLCFIIKNKFNNKCYYKMDIKCIVNQAASKHQWSDWKCQTCEIMYINVDSMLHSPSHWLDSLLTGLSYHMHVALMRAVFQERWAKIEAVKGHTMMGAHST